VLQSPETRRWADFECQLRASKPIPKEVNADVPARPTTLRLRFSLACQRIATSSLLSYSVTATLALNGLALATSHAGEPIELRNGRDIAEAAFACIYLCECVVLGLAHGGATFVRNRNHAVAAGCTIASLIDTGFLIASYMRSMTAPCGDGSGADELLRLMRAARLVRLLRLINRVPIPHIDLFVTAAKTAAPLVLRIVVVVGIIGLVFAQIGVALFHSVSFGRGTLLLLLL
jgi:hypothetical protein